jgi:uncharacterized protein (DUF58 family)
VALTLATETFTRFERLSFVTRRDAQAGLGGEHRSRRRAPSTDFTDYRPYQPGDDFRRVDWNIYGRLGTLQVKLTEARERLDVALVLDCSASMAWGRPDKLEFAASIVAALGYVALARSDAVRVVCLREVRRGGARALRGRARLPDLMRFVSQAQSGGRVDLNTALAECLPSGSGQRLVVLVSDLLTPEGMASGLDTLLGQRTDVVVLHVFSPDEQDPKLAGEIELLDAESGDILELGASLARWTPIGALPDVAERTGRRVYESRSALRMCACRPNGRSTLSCSTTCGAPRSCDDVSAPLALGRAGGAADLPDPPAARQSRRACASRHSSVGRFCRALRPGRERRRAGRRPACCSSCSCSWPRWRRWRWLGPPLRAIHRATSVLVLDASASMLATDVAPNRFGGEAKAIERLASLARPTGPGELDSRQAPTPASYRRARGDVARHLERRGGTWWPGRTRRAGAGRDRDCRDSA